MSPNRAIKFTHFVKTNYKSVEHIEEQYGSENLQYDKGGWRDRALRQERGYEFKQLEDAEHFAAHYGGEYSERVLKEI